MRARLTNECVGVFGPKRLSQIPLVWARPLRSESATLRTHHWAGGDVKRLCADDKRVLSLRGASLRRPYVNGRLIWEGTNSLVLVVHSAVSTRLLSDST